MKQVTKEEAINHLKIEGSVVRYEFLHNPEDALSKRLNFTYTNRNGKILTVDNYGSEWTLLISFVAANIEEAGDEWYIL